MGENFHSILTIVEVRFKIIKIKNSRGILFACKKKEKKKRFVVLKHKSKGTTFKLNG